MVSHLSGITSIEWTGLVCSDLLTTYGILKAGIA